METSKYAQGLAELRNQFLYDIFKAKNLTFSSKRSYVASLTRLNNNEKVTSLKFLEDSDGIIDKIKSFGGDTTRRNYTSAVCTVIACYKITKGKITKKLENSYNTYVKFLAEINKNITETTQKKEKSDFSKNWVSKDDIRKIYNDNIKTILSFSRKKKLTDEQYMKLLKFLIFSLYFIIPPRRLRDYYSMYIVDKFNSNREFIKLGTWSDLVPEDVKNLNYLDKSNLVFQFNTFKNVKSVGTQNIDNSDEEQFIKILKIYLQHHPLRSYFDKYNVPFLVFPKGMRIDPGFVSKVLSATFGKNLNISLIRKIYFTNKYGNEKKKLKKDIKNTGTSMVVAQNNYIV